jgi:Fe-S-cluster-containing dehydrogenase component
MVRYGMVINLQQCFGCGSCVMGCRDENVTPPGVWWATLQVQETGKYPNARITNLPLLCMHCENAPCVDVCPTGASYKRADGIVLVDQDKCIGCKYCIQACPYGARHFIERIDNYYPLVGPTPVEQFARSNLVDKVNPHADHQIGTVEKCTFCEPRLANGQEPACVKNCPFYARVFGDLDDPNSDVAKLIAEKHAVQLKPEYGTNPSVYYVW